MANTLQMFGADWEEVNDEFRLAAPGSVPLDPSTRLDLTARAGTSARLRVHLVAIWDGVGRVEIDLSAGLNLVGSVWRPNDRPMTLRRAWVGRPGIAEDRLRIGLGPLQLRTSGANAVVDGDDLALVTSGGPGAIRLLLDAPDEEQPLIVSSDHLTLHLDLPGARVSFGAGSFRARVASLYRTERTGVRDIQRTELRSQTLTLPLDAAVPAVEILLVPVSVGGPRSRLFLNPELDSRAEPVGKPLAFGDQTQRNGIVPSLELIDYRLGVRFEPVGNDPLRPRLTRLRAVAIDESDATRSLRIRCHGALASDDRPLILSARELDLKLRVGSPLNGDSTNMPALVVAGGAIETVDLPEQFHGIVPGFFGRLRGARRLEFASLDADADDTASRLQRPVASLPRSRQVPDALSCYESLPTLARTIDPERDDPQQGMFDLSLLELTEAIEHPPARPLRFVGPRFLWPMIDLDRLRRHHWTLASPGAYGLEDRPEVTNPLRTPLERLNEFLRSEDGPLAVMDDLLHASRVGVKPAEDPGRRVEELVPEVPVVDLDAPDLRVRATLQTHVTILDFNNIQCRLPVLPEGMPDNPVPPTISLERNPSFPDFEGFFPHRLTGELSSWFKIPFDAVADGYPVPVPSIFDDTLLLMKLQVGKPLQQVVDDLRTEHPELGAAMDELTARENDPIEGRPVALIDPQLLEPGWAGLVLVNPAMQFLPAGLQKLLAKVLSVRLRYLALTARIEGVSPEFSNVYGTFRYVDDEFVEDDGDIDSDVYWNLGLVDIRFRDQKLIRFEIHGSLTIRKFFRVERSGGEDITTFRFVGRYQAAAAENNPSKKDRIVFQATTSEPVRFDLPAFSPFDHVQFLGIHIFLEGLDTGSEGGTSGTDARFALDGEIFLREDWDNPFGTILQFLESDQPIPFRNLGLPLPAGQFKLTWEMPSIEFPLRQRKPIELGPLQFRLNRLGLTGREELPSVLKFRGEYPASERFVWILLDVELFKYPDLSPKAGTMFGFQLLVALDDHDVSLESCALGIRGLDFNNLDIDLFRFLRFTADRVELFNEGNVQGLAILNAKLEILGKTVVEHLTAIVFEEGGRKGFAAFINDPFSLGPIQVQWVLLVNGVMLGPDTVKLLLKLEENASDSEALRQAIARDCKRGIPAGASSAVEGRWGMGIGFSILGEEALTVKVLFVDGGATGLMLKAPFLEDIFGFPGFAVAYIRGPTPDQDRWWTEFRVPRVITNAFNFLGGTIGIEIGLNGSFLFDAGFPWLIDGFRRWDRGFGFHVEIFIGHAGFYLRYAKEHTARGRELTLAGGYAVAGGLGLYFEFWGGILILTVSVELYVVLEGLISIEVRGGNFAAPVADPSLTAADFRQLDTGFLLDEETRTLSLPGGSADRVATLARIAETEGRPALARAVRALATVGSGIVLKRIQITGTIGLYVQAKGELNVWVLSASVSFQLFAEAAGQIFWEESQPLRLIYAFRCGALIEASCRVGPKLFRWTFTFSRMAVFEIAGQLQL